MTIKRETYVSPITETLELCLEEGVLVVASNDNDSPNSGYDNGWDLGSL